MNCRLDDFLAVMEAEDIDLHLRTLRRPIAAFEEQSFTDLEPLIPALFHTLALIWTHSHFYCRPPRIVTLLTEFCNLLIDKVCLLICLNDLNYVDWLYNVCIIWTCGSTGLCVSDSWGTLQNGVRGGYGPGSEGHPGVLGIQAQFPAAPGQSDTHWALQPTRTYSQTLGLSLWACVSPHWLHHGETVHDWGVRTQTWLQSFPFYFFIFIAYLVGLWLY